MMIYLFIGTQLAAFVMGCIHEEQGRVGLGHILIGYPCIVIAWPFLSIGGAAMCIFKIRKERKKWQNM